MSDKVLESLSALMDNEAEELELRRILKRMPAGAGEGIEGDGIRAKWARYHLISATLRQEAHSLPTIDLLSGINAAIDREPLPVRTVPNTRLLGAFKYLGQSAIAASVALGVLFTAQYLTGERDAGVPALADAANVSAPVTTGEYQEGELTRTASFSDDTSLDQEARDRLTEAVYREFQRSRVYEMPVNSQATENQGR